MTSLTFCLNPSKDEGDITDIWCFQPGIGDYTNTCPASPPPPAIPDPTRTIETLFEENGIIIKQGRLRLLCTFKDRQTDGQVMII